MFAGISIRWTRTTSKSNHVRTWPTRRRDLNEKLYVTIGQGSERRITQGKTHESILEQSKKYVIREKISCGTSD